MRTGEENQAYGTIADDARFAPAGHTSSRSPAAGSVAVASDAFPVAHLGHLLRLKSRLIGNRVRQAVAESPIKVVMTVGFLVLIWTGLYVLFWKTFELIGRAVLEGIVAIPVVFQFFFVALTVMLSFSNAIIIYGGLFAHREAHFLLSSPIRPVHVVALKYFESLLFSSWSLVLLGLPLMAAMARAQDGEPSSFYPLFLAYFLCFVPIPGAIGLVVAWALARWAPRRAVHVLIVGGVLLCGLAGWWSVSVMRDVEHSSAVWLKSFYDNVAILQNALWPHMWVASGIVSAANGDFADAGFYLFVTAANGLFLSWVAILLVAGRLMPAFGRAQVAIGNDMRRGSALGGVLAEAMFFYLPRRMRLLAMKDLRTFLRDPLQWSQLVILLALLALYVVNVRRLRYDLSSTWLLLLTGFLNLTSVSLILATFTSRFVFPLVSLEGQQQWCLGLLPLRRGRLVLAKFLYAVTVTLLAALLVMGVSVRLLQLPMPLAVAHIVIIAGICIGLCGIAVGVGARLPMFGQNNPARIASGFGGTVSLICSLILVVASLAGAALLTFHAVDHGRGTRWDTQMIGIALLVVVGNVLAALTSLAIGTRHFENAEF